MADEVTLAKPATSDLMTKVEAAAYLRLTLRGLEEKMRRGELPYYKLGVTVRFRRSVLDAYLNEQCLVPVAA